MVKLENTITESLAQASHDISDVKAVKRLVMYKLLSPIVLKTL